MDQHEFKGKLYKFTMDNGDEVTVTPNHGMLSEGHLVIAHNVEKGQTFQVTSGKQFIDAKVKDIKVISSDECQVNMVYNVVTPGYNIVANNILASCKGEDGVNNYPAAAWMIGDLIYKIGGAKWAKKYYHFF